MCVFRWCGPCKILGPRLEKAVAKQKGRVAMAKVDIDDHTDLAIEYGVRFTVFIKYMVFKLNCQNISKGCISLRKQHFKS